MKKIIYNILLLCLLSAVDGVAQDLIYTPKNPAFGGNTFNYQWLLSSAQAQNDHQKDPSNLGRDPLQDFQNSLNRQILGHLSRQLVNAQFGEEGLPEGTFVLDNFQVEVTAVAEGISILILDFNTGNQTSVVVPYF